MQCQSCKQNTATIHLTEINGGQRHEMHLCEACAQQQGLAVKNQIPLNELLSTLLAVQAQHYPGSGPDDMIVDDAECPHCGMTLKRFRKELLLGCPADYEVFDKAQYTDHWKIPGAKYCTSRQSPFKSTHRYQEAH